MNTNVYRVTIQKGSMRSYLGVRANSAREARIACSAHKLPQGWRVAAAVLEPDRPVDLIA